MEVFENLENIIKNKLSVENILEKLLDIDKVKPNFVKDSKLPELNNFFSSQRVIKNCENVNNMIDDKLKKFDTK